MGSQKIFIFSAFLVNFFCNIFLRKFPIKLPNDLSCNIHVLNKVMGIQT